jgi:hypothetical protein
MSSMLSQMRTTMRLDELPAAAGRRAGETGRTLMAVGRRWHHPLAGGGAQ